ncbi:hypothetical protein G6F49_001826 [Rhizopus delemar]|nr:hypothetical protein G6F49_001826 [Rhizopus delemar]
MNNTPHLALKLPEIVSQIVSYLVNPSYQDQDKSTLYKDIYPCLFVNSLWHDCAFRYMWRSILFEDSKTEYDSFLRFISIAANASTIKTCHLQDEYSQWKEMFSNRYHDADTILALNTGEKDTLSAEQNRKYNPSIYRHYAQYRNSIRSITLRKIKEKTINEPLQQIAPYIPRLERLDIYICDYLSDSTILTFINCNIFSTLTYLSLAGCNRITDEAILSVAKRCPKLLHLDLRACGQISDRSIGAIARRCPNLHHLNVGRVRDRERITIKSIGLIAKYTKVVVLGLAGCDMTDECLLLLAKYRGKALERVSVNNCYRLTNKTVQAYVKHCPNLSVFEMKECHWIDDWASVAELVQRRVLLTLCDQQSKACTEWARRHGKVMEVRAPVK